MIASVVVVAASVLLLRSGFLHARRPDRLRSALREQGLWSTPMQAGVVVALPVLEITVGLVTGAAEFGAAPPLAAAVAVGALALGFSTVLAVLLARRATAPCGCGPHGEPVHGAALLRPAVLLAAAGVLAIGSGPVGLTPTDEVLLALSAGVAGAVLIDLVAVTLAASRPVVGR